MGGRVPKARARQARPSRFTADENRRAKLLDAAIEIAKPPPSHRLPSPAGREIVDSPATLKKRRQPHAAPADDPARAKRTRLAHADTQPAPPRRSRRLQTQKAQKAQKESKPKPPASVKRSEPLRSASERAVEHAAAQPTFPTPAAQRLQKRKANDRHDDAVKHPAKRARLTRKNLARLDEMAKKTASPVPRKKRSKSSASTAEESTSRSATTRTTSTSTTSSGFALLAFKNGILGPSTSKPPANLEDMRERLAASRASASPPESEYEGYVDTVDAAVNEATMVFEVGERLLKRHGVKGYQRAFNQAFTAFPRDVGFNNELSAPQPDFAEGLEMQEYWPFPVDEHVDGAVLYKDNPRSVTLAHLAGEWKGAGKDMRRAALQSAYDGAALVYARDQALALLGSKDPPGHAAVTTFTTDGNNLNFYAHYAAASEDGALQYHQYPIRSASLINSYDEHRAGRRWLRNGQDRAREEAYALKDRLQAHWKQRRDARQALECAAVPASDAEDGDGDGDGDEDGGEDGDGDENQDKDEDEDGYEVVEKPPTPAASSLPCEVPSPGSGGLKRKASSASSTSSQ